jgi:transposase InsO family protein
VHRNARLTRWGRQELVRRIAAGTPIAHVAIEMNVSRPTASKWWRRFCEDPHGDWSRDRSSRPLSSPHRTPKKLEAKIVKLRRARKLGPARIAGQLGVPASTVHRVLARNGLNRLAWMDRPTGRLIRRYEHDQPGDLVHVDIKKLGRIRPGGGWRVHGRDSEQHRATRRSTRVGYEYIHTAIDDHSRLAYSEILDDEKADTAVAFWQRARLWFADHGITATAVLTDNGACYQSFAWRDELAAHGIKHRRTRPYRPQTNGKVERFNRTLCDEWAYVRPYRSASHRRRALASWLHTYNHHRCHTAIGGHPPITRVNNLPGQYS